MKTDRTLHIYGQRFPHDSVEIGGTYDALRELADAIDKALAKGRYTSDHFSDHFYVNDDEGYTIKITVIHSGELGRLRVPYSDPDCREGQNSPQLYPSEI